MSLQISDAVIWQETAAGVSVYHLETGDFLTLNETGARIWMLVASDGEREKVISKLSLQFAGPNGSLGSRIRTDVDKFITSMTERGLFAEDRSA